MTSATDPLRDAHRLLRRARDGVLCTTSVREAGWPFGSVTPYAVSPEEDPIVYLSDIAEHTHNLVADDRVSLLVQDPDAADDPQSGGRITLLARAHRAAGAEGEQARESYLTRFPAARAYTEAHGFFAFTSRVVMISSGSKLVRSCPRSRACTHSPYATPNVS